MSEVILEMKEVIYRHPISSRSLLKPFAKKLGPGIFSMDLELRKGQILGLVGPNGAGKTTLLRMLAGIFPIQKGKIMMQSSDSVNLSPITEMDLRSSVGHMPEQVRWQGKVSVENTLKEIAEMRGVAFRVKGLLRMVGLFDIANSTLDQLSQGMRQRLTLATALLGSPKILLLDEPFNGLDPLATRAFEQLLLELANNGVSIIISSHRVGGMVHLVDRLALLHRGQLLIEGTLKEIEDEFELGDRIEIEGTGELPDFEKIIDSSTSILECEKTDNRWRIIVRNNNDKLLENLVTSDIQITTWKTKGTDIVEMICSATGQDLDEIGFGVISSSMMPYKKRGEEE